MLRTAAALGILCVCIALPLSIDRPEIRFGSAGNSQKCLANQIINMPTDVNILLLGSSRMRRGLDPEQLSKSIAQNPKVYNLGRPGFSASRSYVMLRELFDSGIRPSLLVVEAETEALRGALNTKKYARPFTWRADTSSVFSFKDHLTFPVAIAETGYLGWSFIVGNGLLSKIERGLALKLADDIFETDPSQPAKTVCMRETFDNPTPVGIARAERKKARIEKILNKQFDDLDHEFDDRFNFEDNSFSRAEFHYLQKIRELAQQYDAALIVIRPHHYRSPPPDDNVRAKLTHLIPEYLAPPEQVYRQTAREFMDRSHLNPKGREIYTRWLSQEIAKVLAEK
ncbi:hypothetical protein [Actibacterium ureilyticum]|uniref:hypothetical protein n=1 Tax=Actibacterium ureilyticum TaxID=1590614 RepID=UPI000BAA99A3|nr:hypothetical protein [Actibacterium ureilyticum]